MDLQEIAFSEFYSKIEDAYRTAKPVLEWMPMGMLIRDPNKMSLTYFVEQYLTLMAATTITASLLR